MMLSVIIPTYNEEKRIKHTLDTVISYLCRKKIKAEIIVVDDRSKDATVEVVVAHYNPEVPITVLCQEVNQGKGAAVKRGMLYAHGELLMFTDADLSTPIDELDRLMKAIDDGADVAIGSRGLPGSRLEVRQPWYREIMGRTFNKLVQFLLLPGIRDTQCGFKMFTWEAAQAIFAQQRLSGFAFDAELLYIARRKGYSIAEVPVRWRNERNSKVRIVTDSLGMFISLLRIKQAHRDL